MNKWPLLILALASVAISAQEPGWKDAARGRAIILPADHASHPAYKIEWWYYTGNLEAPGGQRFGYQLTFFRVGLDPLPENPSRWTVRDLFIAHFAVTDVTARRYRFAERMNRSGPGWAGASTTSYRVWNDGWQAALEPGAAHHLVAAADTFSIDLRLDERRPPVLHGDRGYSQKGSAPGNASHYYSLTRMPTRGTVTLDGNPFTVTGDSWMDHEFGTSFLEPQQVGWDWFSVQLDDGRDLMIFQMRRTDGTIDPRSSGTLVAPDGTYTPITFASGFTLTPGRTWASKASGARYPLTWSIRAPAANVELAVVAAVDEQELHTEESSGISYWEGAIVVTGRVAGHNVHGRGYLEMTGYAGPAMGNILQ